jgi:MHS family proline/betaine transporter-like MFS transporter
MHYSSTAMIVLGQSGFAILAAFVGGIGAATMVEAVPQRVRCTALSIGYNACFALFGGTDPIVAIYLIERSHNDLSPAFYLMGAAAVSLAVTLTLQETAKAPCGEAQRRSELRLVSKRWDSRKVNSSSWIFGIHGAI